MLTVVALHVVPPAIFALIHGATFYRWRGILTFVAINLVVGNIFENLGVRTGFPYGHYYFTGLMGPKLSVVPILLGLAYVGMAYLSWTLARLIVGGVQIPLLGQRVVTVPLIAASIMVAWDLSQDPVWSTILHAWIWLQRGAYFGVPVTNFFGWYLTVYVMYQWFALYLRGRSINSKLMPFSYWLQALLRSSCCGKPSPCYSASWTFRRFRFRRSAVESERHHWNLRSGHYLHYGGLRPRGVGAARR